MTREHMKELNQWVCWRYEQRGGKETKVPRRPGGGEVRSNDPTTWSSYTDVHQAARTGDWAGIGFVFSKDDPFCGIDFDACINPDGTLAEWAKPWLGMFKASYAEVSPSGTGIKVFVKGKKPEGCKSKVSPRSAPHVFGDAPYIDGKEPAIEVYDHGRYFTVTGQMWGEESDMVDMQSALDIMLAHCGFISSSTGKTSREGDVRWMSRPARAAGGTDWDERDYARWYLSRLAPWRADDYNHWLGVGMALTSVAGGLQMWDEWSRQSSKYTPGDCERRWRGFSSDPGGVAKLGAWAKEDDPRGSGGNGNGGGKERVMSLPEHVSDTSVATETGDEERTQEPEHTPPPGLGKFEARLAMALEEQGILASEFAKNKLTRKLEYAGEPVTDDELARYHLIARDNGIRDRASVQDALTKWGSDNAYNPIHEYLQNLPEWDGTDYIGQLAAHFSCDNPDFQYDDDTSVGYFTLLLRKWLIGAVQRAYGIQQNPMLVLVGEQGIGKSHLVRWLGSDLPTYHVEAAIQPDCKDSQILATNKWLWEVAELEATTRRTDVAALKAFITKANSDHRMPYARVSEQRPMLASYFGSLNAGDYLTDETGNRRFWNVSITSIDRAYSKTLAPGQIWGQAYALFLAGETNELLPGEFEWVMRQSSERYMKETGLESYITRFFTRAPEGRGSDGNEIMEHINDKIGYQVVHPKDLVSGALKRALLACGYSVERKRINGRRARFWDCVPGVGGDNWDNPGTSVVPVEKRIAKPHPPTWDNGTTKTLKTLKEPNEGYAGANKVLQVGLSQGGTTSFWGVTKPNKPGTTPVPQGCPTDEALNREQLLAELCKLTDTDPPAWDKNHKEEELADIIAAVKEGWAEE